MESKLERAYLYDFYGELLNSRQRKAFEEYYFISRQGVHDLVRRSVKALEGYESKLHLVEKFLYIKERVGRIQGLAHSDEGRIEAIKAEIDRISNEILEEL